MTVRKTGVEITKKHLIKIAKSKSFVTREYLSGVKYSNGNKAEATDSYRALLIKFENDSLEDELINVFTNEHMELSKYPNLEQIMPPKEKVPYRLDIPQHKVKEMVSVLKCLKQLKLENVAVKMDKNSKYTDCYLVPNIQDKDFYSIEFKLYIGRIESVECSDVVMNTSFLLDIITFVKDTKECTYMNLGKPYMPVVFNGEMKEHFTYQYTVCPIRVY